MLKFNIFISLCGHFKRIFKMSESNTNILNLSESALNSFKKSGLVQKILDLKGKVVVNVDQHKLCEKIEMKDFQKAENMKLQSDLGSVKNVTHKLEEKMAYLKKKTGKWGAI